MQTLTKNLTSQGGNGHADNHREEKEPSKINWITHETTPIKTSDPNGNTHDIQKFYSFGKRGIEMKL